MSSYLNYSQKFLLDKIFVVNVFDGKNIHPTCSMKGVHDFKSSIWPFMTINNTEADV